MADKVVMPKLGATMEEGTMNSWLVKVGEMVEEGDPIAEIQTDKITMEIEAESTGVLLETLCSPGDIVPVQQAIAYIGEEGEEIKEVPENVSANEVNQDQKSEQQVEKNTSTRDSIIEENQREKNEKVRRTPVSRHLAKENNIDLKTISGTGPLGRIQKEDVEKVLEDSKQKATPLAKKIANDQGVDYAKIEGTGTYGKVEKEDVIEALNKEQYDTKETRTDFKGIRKVIADRISDSFYSAPHVTLNSKIDVTEIIKLREEILPVIEEAEGLRISYNEIIIKAVSYALKKNPEINISLNGNQIIQHNRIDVGMAVAVAEGLVVPVIRNVDQKGLANLTKDAKFFAKQAREGSLMPEDMNGSTFTVSNLGMYAVDNFTPIINQPNAAILGIGRITKQPVITDNEIEIRSIMGVSLSFDHRIVDGAPAAQFITDIKEALEKPFKLMI